MSELNTIAELLKHRHAPFNGLTIENVSKLGRVTVVHYVVETNAFTHYRVAIVNGDHVESDMIADQE